MILTCPKCSTRYLTKDGAISANGRTVRCAKCETTWFVSADEMSAASTPVDPDALALADNERDTIIEVQGDNKPLPKTDPAVNNDEIAEKAPDALTSGAHVSLRDKSDAVKLRRRRKVIFWIWAIPMALLVIAAILGFVFKQDIVNRMPETASFYKSLGVTVKAAGLEIESPIAKTSLIDGETVLVVNSAVKNLSSKPQNVPLIEMTLRNNSDEALVQWHVELDLDWLEGKSRFEFATQFPKPPVDTVKLTYRFDE